MEKISSLFVAILLVISSTAFASFEQFSSDVRDSFDKDALEAVELIHNAENKGKFQKEMMAMADTICESSADIIKNEENLLALTEQQQKQFLKCRIYRYASGSIYTFGSNSARKAVDVQLLKQIVSKEVTNTLNKQARLLTQNAMIVEREKAQQEAANEISQMSFEEFLWLKEKDFVEQVDSKTAQKGRFAAFHNAFKTRENEIKTHLETQIGYEKLGEYREQKCSQSSANQHDKICNFIKKMDNDHQYAMVSKTVKDLDDKAYFEYFTECTKGYNNAIKCLFYGHNKSGTKIRAKKLQQQLIDNTTSLAELEQIESQYCGENRDLCDIYRKAKRVIKMKEKGR
ncbi:hypothetical protein [Glaciecola sp. 1036]|uniref:hypothetical protein n=1 Tax=Alteromonadaceae TaxID=72275 RepID=UPI003D004C9A